MDIEILKGKILTDVQVTTNEVLFTVNDGAIYKLYHDQDCCEDVRVDDIVGKPTSLIGTPILMAEEITYGNGVTPPDVEKDPDGYYNNDSFTWTFYRLATISGYVCIKFYGASNGYYSESVSFCQIQPPTPRPDVDAARTALLSDFDAFLAQKEDGVEGSLLHRFYGSRREVQA